MICLGLGKVVCLELVNDLRNIRRMVFRHQHTLIRLRLLTDIFMKDFHLYNNQLFKKNCLLNNSCCLKCRRAYSKSPGINQYNAFFKKHHEDDYNKRTIYSNDDLMVFNKPQGQSVYGNTSQANTLNTPSLVSILSSMNERHNVSKLKVGLSLKSFYSGIVIFTKSEVAEKTLEHFLKRATSQKTQYLSYLAITVGTPQCPLDTSLSAFISRNYIHDRELSIVQEDNNNTARKSGAMMLASLKVKILATNNDLGVNLVEVSINKDKWEAVEVVLSYFLSPVLGDHIYSSRTQYVMGVPFRASAHSSKPLPQRLPAELKAMLKISPSESSSSLPLFMHRHKATIELQGRESEPLQLTAPLPEHFVSTLKMLNLYAGDITSR